ncbi:MAG: sigma-54-dependent Fis family transcriptional regulator [Myxococcales bacterium]|nr:sigma-54-dependent Fis family transcriptional regulator [Myxococcales bacterium]MCB9642542.1 sigma-54-dependent Fis family transcriptional regulator [Myxococcales bacterium]
MTPSPTMSTEDLIEWERTLAAVYRSNPYDLATYDRERRKIERQLQSIQNDVVSATVEDRISMMRSWLERYASQGKLYPTLWQRYYLCLLRFVLDADARVPQYIPPDSGHIWHKLDQLGQVFEVHECRKLLEIAERARLTKLALNRIRGASSELLQLKRQTWAACFGQDLIRLLVYERLLQELNVLILGPTGSGKELIAQVLLAAVGGEWEERKRGHLSWRPNRTEALNLAEFPRELMAAQIVGYKRGAFTGASQDFRGVLARCNQGAVFLDEIGELPEEGQVVLLRALETRRIRPLGAETSEFADARVIAATHNELDDIQRAPHFRRDLYFRLAGSIIRVPPLRERHEDILPIALGFLDEWGLRTQASIHLEDPRHLITQWLQSDEAQHHSWPGNVRELKRAIAQLLLGRREDPLHTEARAMPPISPHAVSSTNQPNPCPQGILQAEWTMEQVKQWYLQYALQLYHGNQNETARRLQIHRTTIYHALRKKPPRVIKSSRKPDVS